jgi:outer membrane protein TolC
MPLTETAVDHALSMPTTRSLQEESDRINHPILSAVPIDLRGGLTPDAAGVLAVIANPALRAERNRKSLAQAQLLQAGLLPNPSLDFNFDPVTGGNSQGAVTAYGIGINWEVTALITHDAKLAAARATGRAVRLDVAWQEWQFAQAAKRAVYDLTALQRQLDETESEDRRLAEQAELIRHAVDAHQKTLLDLAAAESASQKAHGDFLSTSRDLRHQQLALNQALGLPSEMPVRLAPGILLPSRLQLPSEPDLISGINVRRLDLLGLRQGYESQEQTLRAAVLAQFPKIVLGVHQAKDNTGVQSTGLGVSIDLPIFDQNQGAIATERATRQQLFDEYASRVFEARAAVGQIFNDIGILSRQIAAAEAALPKYEQLVQTYEAALGQHNVDVLSYYTAHSDLSQARIDLLKLKQQLMDNQIALEIASGRYLPQPTFRPTTGEAPQ